jgi:hypothetical protein
MKGLNDLYQMMFLLFSFFFFFETGSGYVASTRRQHFCIF